MHWLARIAIGTLIPRLVNEAYTFITHNKKQLIKIPKINLGKKKKPIKKEIDRTKFTQGMYDFAIKAYSCTLELKAKDELYMTHQALTDYLNKTFNTQKSVVTMTKLFKGKIDRNKLLPGDDYSDKENK